MGLGPADCVLPPPDVDIDAWGAGDLGPGVGTGDLEGSWPLGGKEEPLPLGPVFGTPAAAGDRPLEGVAGLGEGGAALLAETGRCPGPGGFPWAAPAAAGPVDKGLPGAIPGGAEEGVFWERVGFAERYVVGGTTFPLGAVLAPAGPSR